MTVRVFIRIVIGCACVGLTPPAFADVARLSNGGEIRGSLKSDRTSPTVEFDTLYGGRIVIERSHVSSTSRRSPAVEEYVTRSREVANTVEAHWELAEWCREKRLLPQREEQLEAILFLDPEHQLARRGLGHLVHQGRWMTRDESMKAQGYVKHKGKYLTTQEFNLLNKTAAQREAELAWYPKVRVWFGWATSRSASRQMEGVSKIREIADPDAVPALDEFLGDSDDVRFRLLFVSLLGEIAGEKPVPCLVRISLRDPEEQLRTAAFGAIDPEQYDKAVPYYVDALEDDLNDIVQRAAIALGTVGDDKVVPSLIRALITNHKVTVTVALPAPVAIDRAPDGRYSVGGASSGLPPDVEIALRTGQLPYGVQFAGPPPGTQYRNVTVRVDVQNDKVLESLKKLTERDFGYDQDAWQLYWASRQSGVGRL
jgi:hypothetical protein